MVGTQAVKTWRWLNDRASRVGLLALLLLVVGSKSTQAQYGSAFGPTATYNYYGGVGPHGWGAWGYGVTGYGVGPGTSSLEVYSMNQARMNQEMMNAARYQLASNASTQATLAANRIRMQATAAAMRGRPRGGPVQKFDVRTRTPDQAAPAETPTEVAQKVGGLFDPTGEVLWPVPIDDLITPERAIARRNLETQLQAVYQSWVTEGKASLNDVVQARTALQVFGSPLLLDLEDRGDNLRQERLLQYFRSVDETLQDMTRTPPPRTGM